MRSCSRICPSLSPPYGVLLPVYACRRLQVPVTFYLRRIFLTPVLCAIPLANVVLALRIYFSGEPLLALIAGGLSGGLVTIGLYWTFLLSTGQRAQVLQLLGISRVASGAREQGV